jgi:hypothetical protein
VQVDFDPEFPAAFLVFEMHGRSFGPYTGIISQFKVEYQEPGSSVWKQATVNRESHLNIYKPPSPPAPPIPPSPPPSLPPNPPSLPPPYALLAAGSVQWILGVPEQSCTHSCNLQSINCHSDSLKTATNPGAIQETLGNVLRNGVFHNGRWVLGDHLSPRRWNHTRRQCRRQLLPPVRHGKTGYANHSS